MTGSDTPSTSLTQEHVLKRDARGRVRTSPEQRLAVLEQFERSGLSGPAFALVAGINYQTFAGWRHAHKKRLVAAGTSGSAPMLAAPVPAQGVRFVEAIMGHAHAHSSAGSATLHVCLPGGASLDIRDAQQAALAAQLIRALCAQQPC